MNECMPAVATCKLLSHFFRAASGVFLAINDALGGRFKLSCCGVIIDSLFVFVE